MGPRPVLSTITGGTVIVAGSGMVNRDHLTQSLQALEALQVACSDSS